MGGFRLFVFGAMLGLVQGSLEKTWGFSGPAPDLLLVYLVWLGLNSRTPTGLWVAFVGGMLQDSVSEMDLIGLHALARIVIAYLPEWARLVMVTETRFSGVLLVIAATLLQSMIVLSILQTLSTQNLWDITVLYSWGYSFILNSALWLILGFLFFSKDRPEFSMT